jgi:ABC-2 type transport system permease protein
MLSRRSLAVARTGWRLLASDPAPILVTLIMPVLLAAFLVPGAKAQLQLAGYASANGSEQVIPGVAVMFAFLGTQLVGTLFFREHAWGTWDRLRASAATTLDIVVGKAAPMYVVQLAQFAVLLVAGRLLFGYRPTGSLAALALVAGCFVAMLVTFGVMLVAVFPTMDLALVIGNLGGLVMAGLGGALAPVTALPWWAQDAARATPAYWALDALRRITLDHAGIRDVLPAVGVIAAFAIGFSMVAAWRFQPTATKIGTT